MKKIFITLLLFCFYVSQAHGVVYIQTVDSGTCTEDVTYTTGTDSDKIDNGDQVGQSFKPTATGNLCQVQLYTEAHSGTPDTAKMRCGASLDLSNSYYESDNTVTWAAAGGWNTWTFANGLPVTSGTTYYCMTTPNDGVYANRYVIVNDDAAGYTDGDQLDSNSSWTATTNTGKDLQFKISVQ